MNTFVPDWRSKVLHECSPADRSISSVMRREAANYVGTQYWPDRKAGQFYDGYRCENLEQLTFEDETIDLHVHLDVLEHVNSPKACFEEMERTLRPGGKIIFTTPVAIDKAKTERRALYTESGVQHLFEPEYHGNPISDQGALVTFHYGADLSDLILAWAPSCAVTMVTPHRHDIGIRGDHREVFLVEKVGSPTPAVRKKTGWNSMKRALAKLSQRA
ncbi:class I SAM-dependent methyltransferase [Tritonibacter multivorans]|uniref:class I SAM-dependent methyltransferase n=1 Tax=Tritonibacter multivorans TaxID=928856 RepID=UPI00071CC8C9|nr:class I SAM-dependent methyltransferase [Tritonibacter multivorans]MDA7422540.1 class I SAM-dependent methyltransferase [Tritonibacter multivorans]